MDVYFDNVGGEILDADIQAPVVLQNPASAYSVGAALDRLLISPTHRASILSAEITARLVREQNSRL